MENTAQTHHSALPRSLKMLGTLLITLSAITPASSVFIIIPGIISTAGTGAFLSMLIAAFVGICMALVYAELSSAFPLTGGEYAIIGRAIGPSVGFVILGVNLVLLVLVPAVLALGLSTYLNVLFPGLKPVSTAIVVIAIATVISLLNVRSNAVITGIFLVVEILALVVLAILGFFHVVRPFSTLLAHPLFLANGHLIHTPFAAIGMGVSIAIFAYNGYGTAVYFGEETHDAPRYIARAILWALAITVAAEIIPLAALLMGAPDLQKFMGSSNMLGDFITSLGGQTMNTIISLGIALAIFNAIIAGLLLTSRMLFSTGRDAVWSASISTSLTKTHKSFHSPWVATLVSGVLAILACLINENILFVVTGTGLIVVYGGLCLAVIIGRFNKTTSHGQYRMPLFPIAPIVALLVMLYVIYASWLDPVIGRPSLFTTLGICIISVLYYVFVVRRRGMWVLQGPDKA